jgi:phage baseplate assembly protein W
MATLTRNSRDYIDVDFKFTKHPESYNLSIKKNINAVKQSIINLLLLKEGDKPFHPEIKSPIFDNLFELNSVVEKIILESEILKYINAYEPRVLVNSVTVTTDSPNTITCTVIGQIINLQQQFEINILVDRMR